MTDHVLTPDQWRPLAAAHARRVHPWVEPRLARRRVGQRHPVDDFLFEYYPYRPGHLLTWHPGMEFTISGATALADHRDYRSTVDGVTADLSRLGRRESRVRRNLLILQRTATRPGSFGCFGMHEWAMVYGLPQSDVRHPQVPLRLRGADIDAVVDDIGLRCTHFDAYRFFTAQAGRKQAPLARDDQPRSEQPGCVHVVMDLYRYSYEASPFVPSGLVADCFELARAARRIDMRASPYDLSEFGLRAIAVETASGRREYAALQRGLADRAAGHRARVTRALSRLLERAADLQH